MNVVTLRAAAGCGCLVWTIRFWETRLFIDPWALETYRFVSVAAGRRPTRTTLHQWRTGVRLPITSTVRGNQTNYIA
jgi:hypothetical protein